MSADADDGPDNFDDYGPTFSINSNRKPMNQEEFDEKFGYCRPQHDHSIIVRNFLRFTRRYWKPFISVKSYLKTLLSFLPILEWLPKYNWKEDLTCDIMGGITSGVMHVPQGIAYALLAQVPPVVGLYVSLFPPLLYMLFGTSKHNSIGSFAVVSLMAGKSVLKICGNEPGHDLSENSTMTQQEYEHCTIATASALAFVIGIIHIIMGFLRLEIIVTYLSDQLVSGFTTAASTHVLITQLPSFFGMLGIPRPSGFGYLAKKLYYVVTSFHKANYMSTILGFCAMIFMIIGKDYLNPVIQKKLKLPAPFPFELLLVILSTAVSAIFKLHERFNIPIVNNIPTGFPHPIMPKFDHLSKLIPDAISIALVVVALHISLAKLFAKKLNYKIDPGQELYALAGIRTQFATVTSSVFLIAIIAYFGTFLEPLPMCVLSATVIVAMKGMIRKFYDLKLLWPISKIDFSIWIVSYIVTVAWDVTPGLTISIIYALMTTVFRTQFPRWHFLASLFGTNDFRDAERYEKVVHQKGICVFRFDSPLLFTNVDRFKANVEKAFKQWQKSAEPVILSVKNGGFDDEPKMTNENRNPTILNMVKLHQLTKSIFYKHFIIDCSGFTFVDFMGVNALKEVFTEMRNQKVLVYFAAAKAPVRDLFEACGFYNYVPKCNFYPTIRDAVAVARKRRDASSIHLTDENRLEHDILNDVIQTQPMY
uniref:STAS domain-containing protein n=1 Tax=Panagrolaimus sp. JU765 TaxID=591449 RepID=A0AC34Q3B6_9BILA